MLICSFPRHISRPVEPWSHCRRCSFFPPPPPFFFSLLPSLYFVSRQKSQFHFLPGQEFRLEFQAKGCGPIGRERPATHSNLRAADRRRHNSAFLKSPLSGRRCTKPNILLQPVSRAASSRGEIQLSAEFARKQPTDRTYSAKLRESFSEPLGSGPLN